MFRMFNLPFQQFYCKNETIKDPFGMSIGRLNFRLSTPLNKNPNKSPLRMINGFL